MVLVIMAIVAGLVVGVLNPDPVHLDLLVVQAALPLGALVMVALTIGVLLGLLLALLIYVIPGRFSRHGREKQNKGGHLTDQSNA